MAETLEVKKNKVSEVSRKIQQKEASNAAVAKQLAQPTLQSARPAQAAKLVFLSLPALESARPAQAAKPDLSRLSSLLSSPNQLSLLLSQLSQFLLFPMFPRVLRSSPLPLLLWWAQKC